MTMIGASEGDVVERVMDATQGHGADIVFNTVGSPYFDAANRAMAIRGRQIFISTIERSVPFDILAFYRGRQAISASTPSARSAAWTAPGAVLDTLKPGFESGALRPFPTLGEATFRPPRARATRRGSGGAGRRARARRARPDALGRRHTSPAARAPRVAGRAMAQRPRRVRPSARIGRRGRSRLRHRSLLNIPALSRCERGWISRTLAARRG